MSTPEELFDDVKALDEELQKLPKRPSQLTIPIAIDVKGIVNTTVRISGKPFIVTSSSSMSVMTVARTSWFKYHLMNFKRWLRSAFHV